MCDPVTIAVVSLQAVSGVMQQNAAVAQAKQQNALYEANAKNAREAMQNDATALNMRQAQEAEAAQMQKFDASRANFAKQGRAIAAGGEAGVAGNSLAGQLAMYERDFLTNQNTIDRNLEMTNQQLALNREGLTNTYESRKNSVAKGYAPSALAAGLGIAANAAGTTLAAGYGGKGGRNLFGGTNRVSLSSGDPLANIA